MKYRIRSAGSDESEIVRLEADCTVQTNSDIHINWVRYDEELQEITITVSKPIEIKHTIGA